MIILGRLAVDITHQGHGLGATLLQDALIRFEQAADTAGVRAILVQAIDQRAREFYFRFGFRPTLIDDMRLLLLMKDLRLLLRSKPH